MEGFSIRIWGYTYGPNQHISSFFLSYLIKTEILEFVLISKKFFVFIVDGLHCNISVLGKNLYGSARVKAHSIVMHMQIHFPRGNSF